MSGDSTLDCPCFVVDGSFLLVRCSLLVVRSLCETANPTGPQASLPATPWLPRRQTSRVPGRTAHFRASHSCRRDACVPVASAVYANNEKRNTNNPARTFAHLRSLHEQAFPREIEFVKKGVCYEVEMYFRLGSRVSFFRRHSHWPKSLLQDFRSLHAQEPDHLSDPRQG